MWGRPVKIYKGLFGSGTPGLKLNLFILFLFYPENFPPSFETERFLMFLVKFIQIFGIRKEKTLFWVPPSLEKKNFKENFKPFK